MVIATDLHRELGEAQGKLAREGGQAAAALGLLLAYQRSHDAHYDVHSYMQCDCDLCFKVEELKRAIAIG